MTDVKWGNPPPSGGGMPKSELDNLVATLQQRPGEWALVRQDSLYGHWQALARRGAKVTARKAPDESWDIYARWPASE